MSEHEFGRAFMQGEQSIDAAAITGQVMRRDRRRMWILGTVCVFAWMAVVMLPWSTILPMLHKVVEHQAELSPNGATAAAPSSSSSSIEVLEAVKIGTIATFIGSVASMFIAAVCTVSLIILSRRATLRQVNARLQEISLELKRLARAP